MVGYINKNTENKNKVYVGSSNTPDKRWIEHYRYIEDSSLHSSMKDIGIDQFTFNQVDYIDKEEILIKESSIMNECNSTEAGYNMKHYIDL